MRGKRIPYTEEELAFIKENCTLEAKVLTKRFSRRFNRNDVSVSNMHALRRRKGWRTGRSGKFFKGQTRNPGSGCKGPNSTSFKKGLKPLNQMKVGSERLDKDGYRLLKIADPNQWVAIHVKNWIDAHGEYDRKTHCLRFLDGDKTNPELSNLELITRAENMHTNYLIRDCGKENIETIRLIAKVQATANRLEREGVNRT